MIDSGPSRITCEILPLCAGSGAAGFNAKLLDHAVIGRAQVDITPDADSAA